MEGVKGRGWGEGKGGKGRGSYSLKGILLGYLEGPFIDFKKREA